LKEANVCLKAYTSGVSDICLSIKSNSTTYKVGDLIDLVITVSNEGDLVNDLNISMDLDDSVIIKSFQIIKGSFNQNTKVWHLGSLGEGESSVLKLSLSLNQAKAVLPIAFNFDYAGFKPSNITNSNVLNLYYEGNTNFQDIENKVILSKSNEGVIITLLDQNLNPVAGKEITVSLIESDNNLSISPVKLLLDENGTAKFTLNLVEGNYMFMASFIGDSYYKSSNATFTVNVTKRSSPHIIVEETLIKGDEFKVVLIDDNYNPIANKAIKFVVILNNKVVLTKTATTNANGEAKLTGLSKLSNGNYTVKISFGDDYYKDSSLTKKITIKRTVAKKIVKKATKLYVPKKTFKAKKKVKKLTATLKNGKKVIKGRKIVFIINKKKYTAKTNKKGVATVKIKLSKKKTYKVTVKFAGDKYYKASKRTSKVVIK
jgi:hypothetical protein